MSNKWIFQNQYKAKCSTQFLNSLYALTNKMFKTIITYKQLNLETKYVRKKIKTV